MPPHGHGASQYEEEDLGKVFDAHLVRRLSHYLKPYAKLVTAAIFLAILAAALRVVAPLIARHILDYCIPADTPERRSGLTRYSLLYLGLLAAMFANNYSLTYVTAWIGQRGMYDLRKDVFRKLSSLSLRFFDRNPTGRLLTRTTSDVQVLNEFFSEGVVYIFADFVLLFGIIIAWFYFNWRLAVLLLLTGPIMGVAAYRFQIKARAAYRASRVRLAAVNTYLQESLAGIRTVQSFNRENASQKKYETLNARYRDAQIDTVKQYARFFPVVEIISNLGGVIVLAYAGWSVASGSAWGKTFTAGDIYVYLQYIVWFFMPIQELAEKYTVFQGAMASGERIFMLMDQPVDVPDPPQPREAAPFRESVELRNVWFAYNGHGKDAPAAPISGMLDETNKDSRARKEEDATSREPEWVLRDVSMRVNRGQTVALVGATGAGKSTVINLISRLYDVQKGAVLYDGVNVCEYSQASLRRRMAIVLQDVFLFSGTIAENINLGNPAITIERVEQAARYVNAHGFVSRLPKGYQSEVLERGATLSTGQKQLLAFARAVAFDPDILILDEATANIDTETEALIQDALAKLMRDRTCIVVAHRLSTIQNAGRIVVFHHGRIHEEGTHQELLARDGLYRNLYELQYKV